MQNEIKIIDNSDDGRITCLTQATRYMGMVSEAKEQATYLRRWATVAAAEDAQAALLRVIEFASCRADWDSSAWSFECADSNLGEAEDFLGIE